jgi:hypothetical protein
MSRGEIHVELAVNYADDPKVAALARWPKEARAARDLYVQMVCHCKKLLTDGVVGREVLGKLAWPDSPKTAQRQAQMLVEVGLTAPHESGWIVLAFLKRNKSKAQVERISDTRSEAGKIGGIRSGLVRRGEAEPKQSAYQNGTKTEAAEIFGLNTETETETETKNIAPAAPRDPPPRQTDELFEALVGACRIEPRELTVSLRGAVNRALKDLRAVEATPGQVTIRARRFYERYPTMTLTPSALAKHWGLLGAAAAQPREDFKGF